MWIYMNAALNPNELPAMTDLLASLSENGADDRALSHLREEQWEKFRKELIWRYPISEGESAGGFITPVQEGMLWIPYDSMDKEDGELLELKQAHLLSSEACQYLLEDLRSYTDGLCAMLQEAAVICSSVQNNQESRTEEEST